MNTLEYRAHNYERVELKVVRPPLASFKILQEPGLEKGETGIKHLSQLICM